MSSDFIMKANQIHKNRYDYSKVVYVNAKTPVIIICKIHDEFIQVPDAHINRKFNCPTCGYEQRSKTRKRNSNWWSYKKAKAWVNKLQLTSITEWNTYCKSDSFPDQLPSCPRVTYKNEWKGWTDWIGTNGRSKEFISFSQAKKIVHTFGLRSCEDWHHFCKLGKRPSDIPFAPFKVYNEWISWADWLGFNSRANGNLPGVIYVIQNSNLPSNVYKIGRTYRLDKRLYEHERVEQNKLIVLESLPVTNMKLAEIKAHNIALQYGQSFKYKKSKEHFIINDIEAVILQLKLLT